LHPPFEVQIAVSPSCSEARKPVAPGQPGTLTVALLGSANLDVGHVDTASLTFHGANALSTSVQDINHDGIPDLVAVFDTGEVRLDPRADRGTLQGWLKNGRAFFGSGQIRV